MVARFASIAALLLAPQAVLGFRASSKATTESNDKFKVTVSEKEGNGDNVTFKVEFEDSMGHGNDVGVLTVKLSGQQAQFTNQGFFSGYSGAWPHGGILGKADEYVWPIPAAGGVATFVFDHGASDLVFGDVSGGFRPEFEETVYTLAQPPAHHQSFTPYAASPQMILQKMLQEEKKESNLTMGTWQKDGFFQKPYGHQRPLPYVPKLKMADGAAFSQVGRNSKFTSVKLQRPSILDIDNLFSMKPSTPSVFRSSMEVQNDPSYQASSAHGAHGGMHNGMQQHGGIQPHGMQPHGMQHNSAYPQQTGAYPQQTGAYPQSSGHRSGNPQSNGHQTSGQCFPKSGIKAGVLAAAGQNCSGHGKRCSTSQECQTMGGRWKKKYCTGNGMCGCCKEIGMHRGRSYLEESAEVVAADEHVPPAPLLRARPPHPMPIAPQSSSDASNASFLESSVETQTQGEADTEFSIPVEMSVQWLTPVIQKYRCVSVAPQYTKVGGQSLFIAMGWDTESGVSNLDLDLSLVAIDGKKNVIMPKSVYYKQKTPPALSCGYNNFAMRAFADDRSGDEPGDDELVKIDLACLNQQHPDVEAVVVMVNIFTPQQLTWSEIDSAYLRIVSGGAEMASQGNFFIQGSEAVRSFVRLSGNDLKQDPDLGSNGLAVGMFFRESGGQWTFSALMKGVPGRNVEASAGGIHYMLNDLVYPANDKWDDTAEHQNAIKTGAFGEAGMMGKQTVNGLLASGNLPCVSSRADQAKLALGHMNKAGLAAVVAKENVPADVKKIAAALQKNEKAAKGVRQLALATDQLEAASTQAERAEIGANIQRTEVTAATEEETAEAMDDLDGLFEDI